MENVFLRLVNLSLTASLTVLAVLAVRLVFRRSPGWLRCLLWALVAVRLLLPFSIESGLSLIPSAQPVPQGILYAEKPQLQSGVAALDALVNPALSQTAAPQVGDSVNPMQVWVAILSWVWLAGAAAMLGYGLISSSLLRRRLRTATKYLPGIKQSEQVDVPFVLGIFHPVIYLPYRLEGSALAHVIAHEQAHIRRRDHWWKPLGFALLSVYWFNPILWVAYALLCRDIETACDEKVIGEMQPQQLRSYSETLLQFGVSRRRITACPLAFGETNVKERVKKVMNYKKPALWVLLAALLAAAAVAVCFLTDPPADRQLSDKLAASMDSALRVQVYGEEPDAGDFFSATDYQVIGVRKSSGRATVYAWVLWENYHMDADGLTVDSSAHTPAAFTFDTSAEDTDCYRLVESWKPRDGSLYAQDIRAEFPLLMRHKAFDNTCITRQQENCRAEAEAYFKNREDDLSKTVVEDVPAADPQKAEPDPAGEKELLPEDAAFLWPVPKSGTVSREFTGPDEHCGMDIIGETDTPIVAARDGVVLEASYSDEGYGNCVIIDHGDGFSTVYAHCSSLAVQKGDAVTAGQVVASLGNTGLSTGPHCHFEVRLDGMQVDPAEYVAYNLKRCQY